MKYELLAKAEKGKLLINRHVIEEVAERFDGKKLLVHIQPIGKAISPAQRGYYFAGVVKAAAEYFGFEETVMHDYLKSECNQKVITLPNGKTKTIVASTAGLNRKEYTEFVDRCIIRLAELGFAVENPEDYYNRKDNELRGELAAL